MSNVSEVFESMEYGTAPESPEQAQEWLKAHEGRFHHFIKASVVAFAKGFAPIVATEFARRAIFAEVRPSFEEMEAACKGTRGR